MKKYVVLATNDVPKYIFYTPLVCWAWNKIDWHPIVFYNGAIGNGFGDICDLTIDLKIPFTPAFLSVDKYPSETVVQVSRLYGSCIYGVKKHDYLMTSDVDMLPLSDYWKPSPEPIAITSWGHNLSNEHYPICYLGMSASNWKRVMILNQHEVDYNRVIEEELSNRHITWTTDQDIITNYLDSIHDDIILIDRKVDKRTSYPIGRVDRSAWTLDHKQYIDAHLPHDILTNEKSYQKVMALLHHIWPSENFKWFEKYYRDFKKLL